MAEWVESRTADSPQAGCSRLLDLINREWTRQPRDEIFVFTPANGPGGVKPDIELVAWLAVFIVKPSSLGKNPSDRARLSATHHSRHAVNVAHIDEISADRGQPAFGLAKAIGGAGQGDLRSD